MGIVVIVHITHVHSRVEDWLHPFNPQLYHAPLGSYQIANGIFAQAAGGMFGPPTPPTVGE